KIKVALKVNDASIAERAIGNDAPLFLPPRGFCYLNNQDYTEATNKKFRIPFISADDFDDNLKILHNMAKERGFPEPEFYNEKDLAPWPEQWKDIATHSPNTF